MQFAVVKFTGEQDGELEHCDFVKDPDVQSVFRARRGNREIHQEACQEMTNERKEEQWGEAADNEYERRKDNKRDAEREREGKAMKLNIEELKRLAGRLGLPTENGNRLHDLSFWLDSPPAVPEMSDDALKEMLNAAQIVGCDDPLRIVRGFAMRVLQEWGNQEGMHKAFLDAVKPAVAVPAEWREVMTELADDLAIEIDQSYPPERRAYPSEQRRYEREMEIVNRARALLQSSQAATAVPSGWNIRRDGDVLIVQHPDIGGCSVQKEPDWERMIPEAILYSLAEALLQSDEGCSSQDQNEVRHD